jgi:dolichol-phosphate mannosyltransferase
MLSLVIPAHNEEGDIAETVRNLATALRNAGIAYEIVIVNDNSSDGTERILATLNAADPGIRYVNNLPPNGCGFAVRRGLAEFRGEAVAIVMADGSDDPTDVVAFYRKLEGGYDCVFGSRFIRGARVSDYPKFKLLLNRLANLLIRALFLLRYNDVTNAFKLYRRSAIAGIQPLLSQHFNLTGRTATQMHHPRPQIRGAAKFMEEPQARHLQAAHQGNGFALPFHHSVLLA